jgi:N-acetylglucosamine-6-sulfatase
MRTLLLCTVALLMSATLPSAVLAPEASAAASRPSFVIVLLDDMRADDLTAMPRTRRLIAAKGATFANAYAPFPLCCPARATLLTGQYAHNHHVYSNYAPHGGVEAFNPRHTIATWLKGRRYATGYIGKYLNGYGQDTPKTYVPPGWTTWQGLASGVHNYRSFALNVNGRLRDYTGVYQTHVLGRQAASFIRRLGTRPYLLVTALVAPHSGTPIENDDPTGPLGCFYTGLCDNATPAVSPAYADTSTGQPLPTSPAYDEADVSDKPAHIRALPPFPPEFTEVHQELYEQRLESLRSADDQVDLIVQALAEMGRLRNTYIVVTSDNGYLLGEHRIPFGKVHPYEPTAHVPLLMRGPGITAGSRVSQLVGLHDLAPTVLRATGTFGAQDRPLDGRSLLPLIGHPQTAAARDLLLEAGPPTDGADDSSVSRATPAARPYRGIRTNTGWKYVEYDTGETEMYHLRTDPDELTNLADNPTYTTRRTALDQALTGLATCTGPSCHRDTGQ